MAILVFWYDICWIILTDIRKVNERSNEILIVNNCK
jgi:hypothetical protein